jgi:hypothetical protein
MPSSHKAQISDVEFLRSRGWIELPTTGPLALWRWRDPVSPAALFTLRDAITLERSRKRTEPSHAYK